MSQFEQENDFGGGGGEVDDETMRKAKRHREEQERGGGERQHDLERTDSEADSEGVPVASPTPVREGDDRRKPHEQKRRERDAPPDTGGDPGGRLSRDY